MKFRNKILLSIWGVVLGLLLVTFVIVNYWMRVQVEARFSDDIRSNYSTVREISALRANQDIKSCQIVAETPRLKAVAELGDKNTALQLSHDLNGSVSSDLFILTTSKGRPLATLINGKDSTLDIAEMESIRRARTMEAAADVWKIGNAVYRGASAPIIVGTDVIGTLTIGFRVRREDITLLQSMTNSDVVLLGGDAIVAATLGDEEITGVRTWWINGGAHIAHDNQGPAADVFRIDVPSDRYIAAVYRLSRAATTPSVAYLLMKPIGREVEASLSPVRKAYVVLSLIVLLITAAIGLIISNSMTKPIASLVRGTGEVARGNYDVHIGVTSGGELGYLAEQFGEMSQSLKEKVRQLAERNTELETILNRLGETERLLQTILDTSTAVITVKDLQGKYLLVNRRFETLFHYSRAESIGKTDYELFPRETADVLRTNDWKAVEAGGPLEWEEAIPHDDGPHTYISNKFPLFDANRAPYAVCSFSTDITDRKKLEEGLRQAQKMESIGTLAGGIAHDFNNILAIILAYVARLERGKFDESGLRLSLDALRKATQRGAALVRQILTFARKTDILLESVNLNSAVEELVKMLSETFPKTVTFTLDLNRQLPSIVADAGQVQQSLLNLCVNARDAMPNGGRLAISTRIVHGSSLTQTFPEAEVRPYACVDITDTGTGMDDATRARIFEPFFTTKEIGRGTGLGLSVVFGILRSHHGFIDVESVIGRGTTFHLYFPIPPGLKSAEEKEVGGEGLVEGGSETILLVEDEAMLRDVLKISLEERGYNVIPAQDGVEAVTLFSQQKENIALVLCDMGLPKLGGWEALKIMRELSSGVKVILASGYLDPALKAEMLRSGAADFVQKPYDPDEIAQRVREVIDGTPS